MNDTVFLRFPDRATFEALLPTGYQYAGETLYPLPDGITALSIIGTVYTGGTFNADGTVATAPVAKPGWHVNVLVAAFDATNNPVLPAGWSPYLVTPDPATPVRIFG